MRYYAILDTNVLVSALLRSSSIPGQVAMEALIGDIVPVVNDEIIREYENVLHRPKFHFDPQTVDVFLEDLKLRAMYVAADMLQEDFIDQKDIVFYAVLMETRKEDDAYLVTGNLKHFPVRPFIVSPREMLEIMGKSD